MSRSLVLLCHANVARSPSAELIATGLINRSREWTVESAGTHAVGGQRIDPTMGDALRARGIGVSSHHSRRADEPLLRDADLILTFDSAQREWVAQHVPSALRCTTTIRRAAQLVQAYPGTDLIDLLARDTARYGEADDFADPFGKGARIAASAVDDIETLLRSILPAIGAVDAAELPPYPKPRATRRSLRRSPGRAVSA